MCVARFKVCFVYGKFLYLHCILFFLLTTSCIIPTLLESTETGCPILAGSYLGYLCTLFPKYVMPSDLPRWKVLLVEILDV